MSEPKSNYPIYCAVDDKITEVFESGDDYICAECGTKYEAGDGVINKSVIEDMSKLYNALRLAGFIEERD